MTTSTISIKNTSRIIRRLLLIHPDPDLKRLLRSYALSDADILKIKKLVLMGRRIKRAKQRHTSSLKELNLI